MTTGDGGNVAARKTSHGAAARYRTLDGDELELPLAMNRWVLVPRTLARFDPELAWTLDYDDAPEPEGADPRLDFSSGALLVPVERWNGARRARAQPRAMWDEFSAVGGDRDGAGAVRTQRRAGR